MDSGAFPQLITSFLLSSQYTFFDSHLIMSFLSTLCGRLLVLVAAPALVLMFAPFGIPPHDVAFESEEVGRVALAGALATNDRLDGAEEFPSEAEEDVLTLAAEGRKVIKGPESFAQRDGFLYAGVHGGNVVRYDLKEKGGRWRRVAVTGFPCEHQHEEGICGRPLGMSFDRHGRLVVADAHYGIIRVDVKTGEKEALVLPDEEVEGRPNRLFNSVVVAMNGDIYYSVSSTRYYYYYCCCCCCCCYYHCCCYYY